jgi:SAM-dependent methyltransferase
VPDAPRLDSGLRALYPFDTPASTAGDVPPQIYCPVCGSWAPVHPFGDNERETGHCTVCLAWNRLRAFAVVLLRALSELAGTELRSLVDPDLPRHVRIYSAERVGPIHDRLQAAVPGYEFGEFFPGHRSGDVVDGVQHQDLTGTSFADGTFDLVLTSDVFEHIPEPYVAHREIHRILKPGGRHLFTVPAVLNWPMDWQRALATPAGVERLADPEWHGTELDQNLVYTMFGLESLVELRGIGFHPRVWYLDDPKLGILGPNTLVYEAQKAYVPSDRPIPTGRRAVAGTPITSAQAPPLSVVVLSTGRPDRALASLTAATRDTVRLDVTVVEQGPDALERGLATAESELALLLTDDIAFEPGFLAPLVAELRRPDGPDAVSPTVVRGETATVTGDLEAPTGVCLLVRLGTGGARLEHVPSSVVYSR